MTHFAEFEEKEYESPLYGELVGASPHLWTPGQVFEEHLGFDAALEVSLDPMWDILGYRARPKGVIPDDLSWGFVWRRIGTKRPLPNFMVNAFIQAKRPQILRRRANELRSLGLGSPFWRFAIAPHQQRALEAVSDRVGNGAVVLYAAAAFGTFEELFKYSESRAVVDNSTFVSASKLKDHDHWAYDRPGTAGIACSDPDPIEDEPLQTRIARAAEEADSPEYPDADAALRSLEYLSNQIYQGITELDDPGPRSRQYLRLIQAQLPLEQPSLRARAKRAFIQVQLFAYLHGLSWAVVG